MFEKLFEREKLLSFLKQNSAFNTFMIGDLFNFGMDGDECEFFAYVKENEIKGVIMRFRSYFLLSSPYSVSVEETTTFIHSQWPGIHEISGPDAVLKQLSFIKSLKPCNLVTCTAKTLKCKTDCKAELLRGKDAYSIVLLERSIEEFNRRTDTVAHQSMELKADIEKGNTIVYGIKNGDKVISSASLSAINPVSAMVVGVCTDKEYRQKGFAYDVLSALLNHAFEVLNLDNVSLFWNNDIAGKMYAKVGFISSGEYTMGTF